MTFVNSYFYVFILLVVVSIGYYKLAVYLKLLDKPNKRSSHKKNVILGMGLLFYISFAIFYIESGLQNSHLFLGATIIALLSFVDDLKPLNSRIKLIFQTIALFFVLLELIELSTSAYYLFSVLVFAGVLYANVYNFMDGINGILVSYSVLLLVSLVYLNGNHQIVDNRLLIYPLMALIIFGGYNFRNKAIAFSGDVGSVFLGVLFFYLIILFVFALNSPLIVMLTAVYLIDSLGTLVLRVLKGKNIMIAHREHIYEKLVDSKMNHLQVSIIYALIQMFINVVVLVFYNYSITIQLIVIVSIALVLAGIYAIVNCSLKKLYQF